jgi:hypothetical protein
MTDYRRDVAGVVPTSAPAAPIGQLKPRVNFGDRHPSLSQTSFAVLVWGLTIGLIGATIYSMTAVNVKFISLEAKKCPEGWVGPDASGLMCYTKSLQESWTKCNAEPRPSRSPSPSRGYDNDDNYVATDGNSTGPADIVEVRRLMPINFAKSEDDKGGKSMFQIMASPYCLPILLPALFLGAIGWFVLLRFAARCAVWSTVGVFLLCCGLGMFLTDMRGWPIAVVGVATLAYMIYIREQINQGCQCLEGGLKALSEMNLSVPIVMAVAVILLIYVALFVAFLSNASFVATVTYDSGLRRCAPKFMVETVAPVMQFVFFFFTNWTYMLLNFIISFAIGCWYFHCGDPEAPSMPMVEGFRRALFSRNGNGVCGQAGIVMAIVEWMEKEMKALQRCPILFCNPIMCIFYCLMTCFKQCLESLATFAVVAVALEGGPFCETARKATHTLGVDRVARFLVIDATLGWILKMQAVLIATAFGFLCFFVMDKGEELGIFAGIGEAVSVAKENSKGVSGAQAVVWMLTAMIVFMGKAMKKPLSTIIFVVILQIVMNSLGSDLEADTKTGINAVLAALFIGAVGSLLLMLFAEAGSAALTAMTYCWCLDEALPESEAPVSADQQTKRQEIAKLMGASTELHAGGSFAAMPGFAPAPPPPVPVAPNMELGGRAPVLVSIQCPEGVGPGQQVQAEVNGVMKLVTIPQGVGPGQIFQVQG